MGAAARSAEVVYVSNADSHEISVLSLDARTGDLSPVETVPVDGAVMPLALSPDRHRLYAALRSQPFRVVSFAIEPGNGHLRKLGESALADSMANIATDKSGHWLFAASYGGNKITVNSIANDGVVGAVQQLIATAPNAHSMQSDNANRFVFATSLGGDQITSWKFDVATGALSANSPPLIKTADKSGPRHIVFDRNQRFAYVTCEVDASLLVFSYDAAQGTLHPVQRTTVLPAGFPGKPWAADLHLSPDGRFLYASERTSSTLSTFRVDAASGELSLIGQVPTEKTPRGFAIDPAGHYLVAAGQDSNGVSVYAIDPDSGALNFLKRYGVGRNPNWIEIVDLQ
jgi:6-phosphogluconolactonase